MMKRARHAAKDARQTSHRAARSTKRQPRKHLGIHQPQTRHGQPEREQGEAAHETMSIREMISADGDHDGCTGGASGGGSVVGLVGAAGSRATMLAHASYSGPNCRTNKSM